MNFIEKLIEPSLKHTLIDTFKNCRFDQPGNMPRKTRTPSTANGSPLSPPPNTTAGDSKPSAIGPTSPLGTGSGAHYPRRRPSENPVYRAVQSLSKEDQIFLTHDFEKVSNKPTKLQYYNIIRLFKPDTTSKPSDRKDALKAEFVTKVRPLLEPYLSPPPEVSMEPGPDLDFDPLGRKTTQAMLVKAIEHKSPDADIAPGANIDDVLILYKYYVDPQLKLPLNRRFIARPRTVPIERLKAESMEDIIVALRYFAPSVHVRSLAMNKNTLMDLYIHFVHDRPPQSPLIEGYHYTTLELSQSDSEAMES
ncbi:uncharacterized protein MELLADRAFT_92607 [Melampsora larici-populina 98AG31]|uniref:Uncharacterized protein n=1 Tax=Melampsora larici-populina (strain 98AG31 / pathotype 3-4-7) TaxID=747676 RepID=F4S260_MELLP|nr:uncharacterized protein MELLADRAFT_92607 [Melampsora larici-populina 98AG31]EGG01313.1 hypothetical protein MELLADRAFT_92607 [Melampsora larici-populina 98AG31]